MSEKNYEKQVKVRVCGESLFKSVKKSINVGVKN